MLTFTFVVTNSSMPSVSRTDAGIVTRAVVWFHDAWVAARKVMLSPPVGGGTVGFAV